SADLDTTPLPPGEHKVEARAWSGVGHSPVAVVSFKVVGPPRESIADPTFFLPVAGVMVALLIVGFILAARSRQRTETASSAEPKSKTKD
ncbi:MAG TPA: hypothetical protein VI893_01280, partial [Thermoplasmata archaeon]|nr:hypothetical protein [Thermoplasmata archaeon]